MKLNIDICIKKFVIYEKKIEHIYKGKKIGTLIESMEGVELDEKKGFIYELIDDYGTFKDIPKKIPNGYKIKNKKITKNIATNYYCKIPKTKKQKENVKNKLKDSLEFSKWYDKSRKYWLTIKDFKSMNKGDKIVILSLHRNLLDIPLNTYKENKSYRPETVFKSEKDTYIYMGDFKVKSQKYDDNDNKSWSLHVEYKKNYWYPLNDKGILPLKSVNSGVKLLNKRTHWSEFSNSTHVGWRGPMILWKDLKNLPKIHFLNEDYY